MVKGVFAVAALSLVLVACAAKPASVATTPKAAAPAAATDPSADSDDATDDGDEASDDTPASESASTTNGDANPGPCTDDMVLVDVPAQDGTHRRWCIDKYEASLVETMPDGSERAFPHYTVVDGHDVRAVSKAGVFPQGFISEVQARDACAASNKHLCTYDEWKVACMGPQKTTFPYGDARRAGTCHDSGKSAVGAVFGAKALAAAPSAPVKVSESHASKSPVGSVAAGAHDAKRAHVVKGRAASTTKTRGTAKSARRSGGAAKPGDTKGAAPSKKGAIAKGRTGRASTKPASVDMSVWTKLNDPALGQVEGALSKTGEHAQCVNGYGAFDMVGNLHEWVATEPSLPHGTFAGGYYLDTSQNGDGCNYRTVAHAHDYHDYSTGFRCCAAAREPAR